MRAYLQQIRHETGVRVVEKVFDPVTDKPSKVNMAMEKYIWRDSNIMWLEICAVHVSLYYKHGKTRSPRLLAVYANLPRFL